MKSFFTLFILFPIFIYVFSQRSILSEEVSEKYRTGNIDPIVLNVPEGIQSGISRDSQKYSAELVRFLTKDTNDDFLKVKRIHDWITENIGYDNDHFYGSSKQSEPLQDKRSTCGGFATLFRQLVAIAGIEVIDIPGKSRETYDTKINDMASHVWNAVKIGEEWYIVDTTHDSRFSYTDGKFGEKSEYRDTNLFVPPRNKIKNNFPDNPEHQFLKDRISYEEFLQYPLIHTYLFTRSGLAFANDINTLVRKEKIADRSKRYFKIRDTIHSTARAISIKLYAPDNVSLSARLTDSNGHTCDSAAFCYREDDQTTCNFSAPDKGQFEGTISSKIHGRDRLYNPVYSFTLISDTGGEKLPSPYHLYELDNAKRYGISIIDHNMNDKNAEAYFIRLQYPKSFTIFSTVWDEGDKKIDDSSRITPISEDNRSRVVEYRYSIPPRGIYFIKIRAKPETEKLYNDTVVVAKIVKDQD